MNLYQLPLLALEVCTSIWQVTSSRHLTDDMSGIVGSRIFYIVDRGHIKTYDIKHDMKETTCKTLF
jgi:hypothetical protein